MRGTGREQHPRARRQGRDDALDLAIVKIGGKDFPYVRWPSEDAAAEMSVGQWIAVPGQRKLPIAVGIVGSQVYKVKRQRGHLGVDVVDSEDGPRVMVHIPFVGTV